MVEIKNGRVYVDDKETVNPVLIGYAMLDAAEELLELPVNVEFSTSHIPKQQPLIENFFNIEDIVYLKHDIEQLPRMVIEVVLRKHDVVYTVQCGPDITTHSDFEMSKTKTMY